jgi:superfamily II DNA or RNA helicase
MSYTAFLASKQRAHGELGRSVTADELHPMLHDWQAEATAWAIRKGRCAIFWDCGLGKTFAQIEWATHSADRSLILAPLSVARQTVREAAKLGRDVHYVRSGAEVDGPGVWITNYELADRFDWSTFGAVVADESSILKNVDGKTRRMLTENARRVPRLACTATPAPNDVAELTNHAEWLGVMSRAEMLAAYFVNDEKEWRLKGHAVEPMFRWMSSWAHTLRSPADMGYPADDYRLPPLEIVSEIVDCEIEAPDGQLFAADLGGVGGRIAVRRQTVAARVDRAVELAGDGQQWIVWCGLNDEAAMAARLIDGAVNVEGSWSPDAKAQALEAFQDGEIRVLVTKPSIAGFGMNFQNCSRMAFVGLSDSYEAYYQAIRRCWRYGQTEPVQAHIVVSGLESQIAENVRRKERQATAATTALIRNAKESILLGAVSW